jgi:hypothetical protein
MIIYNGFEVLIMTKVVKREMYCSKCNKSFEQPVYMSVSTFLLSEEEKQKLKDGTLFKNFCPECGKELSFPPKDGKK